MTPLDPADPVAAVEEEGAPPDVADLFDDIRATLGVPVVNLIWRHVATIEGGLPWLWATLKPLYVTGAAGAAAAALRRGLTVPELPAWPAEVLRGAGIGSADEGAIRLVLDSYHRSNALNLIALSSLFAEPAKGRRPAPPPDEPPIAGTLPRLLALDAMAPETARLVLALDRIGARERDTILASMWRHLAHWPPYLALAWAWLAPVARDGRLARLRDTALADAAARAARLGRPPEPADPKTVAAVRAAVRRFVDGPIGRMVPVCAILHAAMPPRRSPRA